jgi:hypothetical protein
VAGARSSSDVALPRCSCCGSRGRGRGRRVAAIGDGEELMLSPSRAVAMGGGGEEHGWWWVGRREWPCLVAK